MYYVVAKELECVMTEELFDVALRTRVEVVNTQHIVPFRDERVAEVRADKTRAPGDEDTLPECHRRAPLFHNARTLCGLTAALCSNR